MQENNVRAKMHEKANNGNTYYLAIINTYDLHSVVVILKTELNSA